MRSKDIRRIMKSGGSMVISLPRNWIELNKLRPGDSVELEITKNAVIIRARGIEKSRRTVRLEFHGEKTYLINSLVAAYLLGYDTIVVEIPRNIREMVEPEFLSIRNKLMGLEMIESTETRIVFKVPIDPLEMRPKDTLRMMWQITGESIEDSITSILEEDVHLAERVVHRDEEVDKLYFYTVRVLRSCADDPVLQSKLELTNIDLLDYRVAAHLFEDINDRASDMAVLAENGLVKSFDKQFLERLKVTKTLLKENHDDVYRIFFNGERERLPNVEERTRRIRMELTLSRLTSLEVRVYEAITTIARNQHDIAELYWMPFVQ